MLAQTERASKRERKREGGMMRQAEVESFLLGLFSCGPVHTSTHLHINLHTCLVFLCTSVTCICCNLNKKLKKNHRYLFAGASLS